MKIIVSSFKRSHALPHSVPPTLQQATANPCLSQRFLDTTGKFGSVSCGVTAPFSWSWCTQGLVCVLQQFPQSCVSSGSSMMGLMVTSSMRAYAPPRSAASRAPAPVAGHCCTSIGDTQTLKGRSGSVSVGFPGVHKVLFELSEYLWWVWSLILNVISPLLPSC